MSRFNVPDWKSKEVLPPALMVVGAVLLLYVLLQYGTMYTEQHRLSTQWEQQNRTTAREWVRPVSEGLTRVTIPKINLDAVVVEGTGRKELLLGPGHMLETPAPGEAGNAVITGHRDTFFRHLYELSTGDEIEIRRNRKLYTYQVTGKKIVQPEDISVIRQSPDKRLTLITCYPTYYIGPAPERLVVFARLVEEPEGKVVKVSRTSPSP